MPGRSLPLRSAILVVLLFVIGACALGPSGTPAKNAPGAGPTVTLMPTPSANGDNPASGSLPRAEALVQEINAVQVPFFDAPGWFSSVNTTGGKPFPAAKPPGRTSYTVGSVENFKVGKHIITARLAYQNAVVNMWVETWLPVTPAEAAQAADSFASKIYPADRAVFGEESSPGVDGDRHINILTTYSLGSNVTSAFLPTDEYTANMYPSSNQRELLYTSWFENEVGSDPYMSTLAHEYQNMIQWNTDHGESVWLGEGLSQVAQRLNGYNDVFSHFDYLFNSQVQLDSWSPDVRQSYAHSGASYLFLLYIDERFGNDMISAIARDPLHSTAGIDDALKSANTSMDDVFGDWVVANYVNDPSIEDGRYGYKTEKLVPICPRTRLAASPTQPPHSTLKQYSANYLELEGSGDFTVNFQGDQVVPIIPTNPRSGNWFFWSNVGDNSEMTLTHAFDLTKAHKARLQYLSWYDIAQGSQGVVEVSNDGGQHWTPAAATSTEPDPVMAAVPDYTGTSGSSPQNPLWVQEAVDLTAYVGQQIVVRFDYVTGSQSIGQGWAIDDVHLADIGYATDLESDDGGWQAAGWVRSDNRVPQRWSVSIVQTDANGQTAVTRLPLDDKNAASAAVSLPADGGKAAIIVGAMAPWTQVPARYSLDVGGTGQMISLKPPPGVLFQDDFGSACSSFDAVMLPEYRFGDQNGLYEMESKTEDTLLWTNAHQKFDDTVLDVDTTQSKVTQDSQTGIMCRYRDPNDYYLFTIGNDSKFEIDVLDQGKKKVLVKPTADNAIHTGAGATNHFTVTCDHTKLSLTVNGVFLRTIMDSTLHAGDIGLVIATHKFTGLGTDRRLISAITDFDNLVVKRP